MNKSVTIEKEDLNEGLIAIERTIIIKKDKTFQQDLNQILRETTVFQSQ